MKLQSSYLVNFLSFLSYRYVFSIGIEELAFGIAKVLPPTTTVVFPAKQRAHIQIILGQER